jgi:hypothetical protein
MATTEDPIPVGHVSLTIAFQRYHGLEHEPLNDQALIDRFRSHLEKGDLRAKVRDPQIGTEFAIPPEAWRGAWYGHRPFFFKTILGNENENGAFKPFAGRTPYVVEAELSAVPEASANAPPLEPRRRRGLYPWEQCKIAFLKRAEQEGAPTNLGGEIGWRTQADVARWIADWMTKETGKEPGEATARRYARKLMKLVHRGSPGP